MDSFLQKKSPQADSSDANVNDLPSISNTKDAHNCSHIAPNFESIINSLLKEEDISSALNLITSLSSMDYVPTTSVIKLLLNRLQQSKNHKESDSIMRVLNQQYQLHPISHCRLLWRGFDSSSDGGLLQEVIRYLCNWSATEHKDSDDDILNDSTVPQYVNQGPTAPDNNTLPITLRLATQLNELSLYNNLLLFTYFVNVFSEEWEYFRENKEDTTFTGKDFSLHRWLHRPHRESVEKTVENFVNSLCDIFSNLFSPVNIDVTILVHKMLDLLVHTLESVGESTSNKRQEVSRYLYRNVKQWEYIQQRIFFENMIHQLLKSDVIEELIQYGASTGQLIGSKPHGKQPLTINKLIKDYYPLRPAKKSGKVGWLLLTLYLTHLVQSWLAAEGTRQLYQTQSAKGFVIDTVTLCDQLLHDITQLDGSTTSMVTQLEALKLSINFYEYQRNFILQPKAALQRPNNQ